MSFQTPPAMSSSSDIPKNIRLSVTDVGKSHFLYNKHTIPSRNPSFNHCAWTSNNTKMNGESSMPAGTDLHLCSTKEPSSATPCFPDPNLKHNVIWISILHGDRKLHKWENIPTHCLGWSTILNGVTLQHSEIQIVLQLMLFWKLTLTLALSWTDLAQSIITSNHTVILNPNRALLSSLNQTLCNLQQFVWPHFFILPPLMQVPMPTLKYL